MNNETALTYEAGIIGSLLLDETRIPLTIDIVAPEDFTSETYGLIYATIRDMYAAGRSVDHITLTAEMVKNGHTEKDMHTLIRDVWNLTPTAANAESYATALRDSARMRRISALVMSALMEHGDPDNLTEALMDGLYGLERGSKKGKAATIGEVLNEFRFWALDRSVSDKRVDTGFPRIDGILHGMYPGNLIFLAARPAVGKSALAADIALRAAFKGAVTVIFSCEMERIEIVQRYMASKAEIDLDNVIDRKFVDSPTESRRAVSAINELGGLPLHIYDEPGVTMADIRRTLQTVRDVGFVVIDYIQLMRTVKRSENRNNELGEISGSLKQIAREFRVPVMVLSQLNRNKDEIDEPSLNDLRDSGSLEQDADKVIMLWKLGRDFPDELPKIGVKIAKNRMGKTGAVVMRYKGERMKFYETAEEYVPKKRGRGRDFYPTNIRDEDFPFND